MLMTVIFFVIGLSVILAYEWGAPTPQFRPDAPSIVLFGVLIATFIYVAARYGGLARSRQRKCTACGHTIPHDSIFCPYCGFQFPPR